jgi:hypothetical protein
MAWQAYETHLSVKESAAATNIANKQWATAKDTEQRQLRAYIGAVPQYIIKTRDGLWALQIVAHNYGQTPARAVQINGGAFYAHSPLAPGEKIPTAPFAYSRTDNSSGLDVYPTKDGTTSLNPFPANLIEAFRKYPISVKVYLAGIVTYTDVFGNFWYTKYCAIIEPKDLLLAIDKPGTVVQFDWCSIRYNRAT